ncbi:MAG TPA: hypothetical protein DEB16_07070 [Ruminococcaceae bacterium]|jgi:hypothetical protein|nr:hypothetical protein [Oscillospiraceae bacterium]HBG55666.1 hypothetical protein [Oscillospiraceae bacterium]HBQ46015.1 hypothetical protein [Oscillospiraceae bacterium]HBT91590.1 hypothetical protein [Oscillospiraceae bacterium]HCB91818.1 hypothetical protein [Oscillospiraceae bacterium]
MLGKLIKYEIRATQRIFLPLYGLILAFALLNRLFRAAAPESAESLSLPINVSAFVNGLTMMVYVALIVALAVMTLIVTIRRFQRGLLGDEGYLMFTLPVEVHSHIDCKMIVTLIWTVLSLLVSALSIFILAVDESSMQRFSEGCLRFRDFFRQYGASSYLILLECIVLFVVLALMDTLQIYASIAVGSRSARHKLLAGFGAFIGFTVVMMTVSSWIFNSAVGYPSGWLRAQLGNLARGLAPEAAVELALGLLILYSALFGVAFYALTNWLLSRKLNLE